MSHKSLFMRHSATRLFRTYATHWSFVATEGFQAHCAKNAPRGKVWQSDNGRIAGMLATRHLGPGPVRPILGHPSALPMTVDLLPVAERLGSFAPIDGLPVDSFPPNTIE